MEEEPSKNRGAEAFDVGVLAVDHAKPAPTSPPAPHGKIGAVAIKNSDRPLVEPGEQVVTVIRRHIIGIIGIYIEMLGAIAVVVVAVILALAGSFGQMSESSKGLISAGAVLVIGFLAALLLISNFVYRQCRIIVTDKSLVAVVQKALFVKKISRLSMSNVEDVTAEQRGLLATIFNYGTLTIQTAGQEDNFIFPLCPRPNDVANQVLEARQAHVRVN